MGNLNNKEEIKKTFEIRIAIFCEEYLRAEKEEIKQIKKELDKLEYLHEVNNLERIDKKALLNSNISKQRIDKVATLLAHRALQSNNIYYDERLRKRYDELINDKIKRANAFMLQHQHKFAKFLKFFQQEFASMRFQFNN